MGWPYEITRFPDGLAKQIPLEKKIRSVRYNVGPLRIRLLVICNLANEPPLLTRHKICLRDLLTDFERMIDGPAYGEG